MTVLMYKRFTLGLLVCCLLALAVAFPASVKTARGEATGNSCASVSDVYEDPETIPIRGGDSSEGLISNFVANSRASLENFHIHGWRWHTLSLVREAGRLRNLAGKTNADKCESLKEATDYVIGFNLKGLHAIEADLFFPWMKQKLVSVQERDLANAFETVMDQLEDDRKKVAQLGDSIKQSVSLACDTSKPAQLRSEAIESVVKDSATLEGYARSMMERENTLLVPSIARIVPESEQKSFNNKVLMNLGLLDSRLHLVGMYEAVQESQNNQEKELFKQAIPSIPQMMIPRWKRKLYDPRTSVLADV